MANDSVHVSFAWPRITNVKKVVQFPNVKKMHGDRPKMTADLVVARAFHVFDGEKKKTPANQPKAPRPQTDASAEFRTPDTAVSNHMSKPRNHPDCGVASGCQDTTALIRAPDPAGLFV